MSKTLHQERMNKVVQAIESNLGNELSVKALSGLSCYSEFHFHRVFRSFVGESVYGYRKRLLLERAVKQLQYSENAITQIAFDCGYDNQASFNKAFKNQYGYTPSQVRNDRVVIQTHTFTMISDDKTHMKPTIKNIDDINVICAREVGSYDVAAPKAWERIMKYGYSNRLMAKHIRSIGITHDDPQVTNANQIRYDACLDLETPITSVDNLIKHVIAGGSYAVFLHIGPYEGLQKTYSAIFNNWLPESEYDLKREQPCFEIYLNRDPRKTKPENLKTEIYVPLG